MGATPELGLPYPEMGDAPNGPQAIQSLAEAVEGVIEDITEKKVQSGSQNVSIGVGASSASATITFPTPFATVPNVALSAGTSSLAYSVVRGGKTTTSVTVTAHRPPGAPTTSAATATIDWIAQG